MKRVLILGAVAILTLGAIGTVAASNDDHERRDVKAKLTGFAEVPAISTTGSGRLRLSINESTSTINFELTYSGLSGDALSAHLHFGQSGVAGGIMANLCGVAVTPKPVCPVGTSATVTGTIVVSDIIGPAVQGIAAGEFAEALRAIRAGMVYVNVHTAAFPGGEIRGQLKGGKS